MKKKERIIAVSYILIFLLVTVALGIADIVNLADYYVNDKPDYNEWKADMGNRFETNMAANFGGKFEFVNMNGAIRSILGQDEMNGIVKLNNGYLLTTYQYAEDDTLQECADSVIELKEYLKAQGIPFLYVITPYTSSKYDPQLPTGIEDYGNDNLDRFAEMLETGGVDVIDIRETLHEDEIDQYDMMYRTDHHWTPLCGFYAYGKMNEWLMAQMNCEVDPVVMNLDNYTITTYENWHLGSRGQRTGLYFTGIDDFDLIVPNFETFLSNNGTEGSYEDLIINESALQNRNPQSRYTYDYVYSNSRANYINSGAYNDRKILVLTDSFGNVVNPFLVLSYYEVRFEERNISYEYIEEYRPDAVIMFYYVNNALSSDYCNFTLPYN